MSLTLYPAIDLRAGRVVRLHQGDYERETVYGDDPVAVADGYRSAGARWVHVVDLDAARGQGSNRPIVATLAAGSLPVQTGGGVRSEADAAELLDAGVARVVVGTAAFRQPGLVERLAATHPGRVAVDLGVAPSGEVVVQGWAEGTGERMEGAMRRFAIAGVAAFVVTSVGRDGTMEGPDLSLLEAAVASAEAVPVIASGGVGTLDHVRSLVGTGVEGLIVGRALYERRFTVEEAVAACA